MPKCSSPKCGGAPPEGITESVAQWRTDVVGQIIDTLGIEKTMFEAADPPVFERYVKKYGTKVNLLVSHS